jgi:ABC-type transport system involved in cytochrome c biogenesis permease subunit
MLFAVVIMATLATSLVSGVLSMAGGMIRHGAARRRSSGV